MSPQFDVAIVVPCFNQGDFLLDLLSSLDRNKEIRIQVIIVDDGSDVPIDITSLSSVASRLQIGFSFVRKVNGGLSSARNAGMLRASASYLKFLDADDLLVPGYLDLQVAYLRDHMDCAVHISSYVSANSDLTRFENPDPQSISGYELTPDSVLLNWESRMSIPIHCALFRTAVLNGLSFNENLRSKEDWLFWYEFSEKLPNVHFDRRVGAIYRHHGSNMTTNTPMMALGWTQALSEICRLRGALSPAEEQILLSHFRFRYQKNALIALSFQGNHAAIANQLLGPPVSTEV